MREGWSAMEESGTVMGLCQALSLHPGFTQATDGTRGHWGGCTPSVGASGPQQGISARVIQRESSRFYVVYRQEKKNPKQQCDISCTRAEWNNYSYTWHVNAERVGGVAFLGGEPPLARSGASRGLPCRAGSLFTFLPVFTASPSSPARKLRRRLFVTGKGW